MPYDPRDPLNTEWLKQLPRYGGSAPGYTPTYLQQPQAEPQPGIADYAAMLGRGVMSGVGTLLAPLGWAKQYTVDPLSRWSARNVFGLNVPDEWGTQDIARAALFGERGKEGTAEAGGLFDPGALLTGAAGALGASPETLSRLQQARAPIEEAAAAEGFAGDAYRVASGGLAGGYELATGLLTDPLVTVGIPGIRALSRGPRLAAKLLAKPEVGKASALYAPEVARALEAAVESPTIAGSVVGRVGGRAIEDAARFGVSREALGRLGASAEKVFHYTLGGHMAAGGALTIKDAVEQALAAGKLTPEAASELVMGVGSLAMGAGVVGGSRAHELARARALADVGKVRPTRPLPIDVVPDALQQRAEQQAKDLGEALASGKEPEELGILPDELQPYSDPIWLQAREESQAIKAGQSFMERLRAEHQTGEPGVSVEQGPDGSTRVVQRNKQGEVVGGAQARDGMLQMIAGGRGMGSPSIATVYEKLTELGIESSEMLETLTPQGAMARRRGAEKATRLPREVLEGRVAGAEFEREAQAARREFERAGLQDMLGAPAYAAEGGPFYSQLRRVVESPKTQAKQTGEQWQRFLADPKRGVKADELKWTGLDDFLAERSGKPVTREEVQRYLDDNEVSVEEVTLGDTGRPGEIKALESDLTALRAQEWGEPGETVYENNVKREAEIVDRLNAISGPEMRRTKFAGYVEPGGQNYRELLLTLPAVEPMPMRKQYQLVNRETGEAMRAGDEQAAQRWRESGFGRDIREVMVPDEQALRVGGKAFVGGHFDEPNVLAHVRFNDRTGPNGERVLFVEELQSDWAQRGRREGFKPTELPEGWTIRKEMAGERGELYSVFDPGGRRMSAHASEAEAKQNALASAGGIPSAPFVTDTGKWTDLALKRVLKYAADNGYDKVAWTPGEIQAKRYDLSKHVSRIDYDPKLNHLEAFDKSGDVVLQGIYPPDKLPDVIGKEATDRLLKRELEFDSADETEKHILEGEDLKVGGKGMQSYYDEIVPQLAGKLVKKFGGRVGKTEIDLSGKLTAEQLKQGGYEGAGRWAAWGPDEVPREFATEAEAKLFAEQTGGDYAPQAKFAAHSVDITPEMRTTVAREGFPLFAAEKAGEKEAAKNTRELLLKLYPENSKIKEIEGGTYEVQLPDKRIVSWKPGVDHIEIDLKAFEKGHGPVAGRRAAGVTYRLPNSAVVEIATGANARVPLHEHWHVIKHLGTLTKRQESILKKRFGGNEEAEADAYAEWFERGMKAPDTIFQRIHQALTHMYEAITGQAGAVFRQATEGALTRPERDLTALHNLTASDLLKADKLGGLPAPSIAITRGKVHEGYGDITMVGHRGMVDPESSSYNKIYPADAYSTRFPDTTWKLKRGAKDKLLDRFPRREFRELGDEGFDKLDKGPDAAIDYARNSTSFRAQFLREKGVKVSALERTVPLRSDIAKDRELQRWLKANPDARDLRPEDPKWAEFSKVVGDAIDRYKPGKDEVVSDITRKSLRENLLDENGQVYFGPADRLITDAKNYVAKTKEYDRRGTVDAIEREMKSRGLQDEYEAWVRKLVAPIYEGEYLTLGRRKVPVTMDNVVEAMRRSGAAGAEAGMTYGPGKARAVGAKPFASIEAVRKAKEKLVSGADFKTWKDAQETLQNDMQQSLWDSYRVQVTDHPEGRTKWVKPEGFGAVWDANDSMYEAIARYLKTKTGGAERMRSVLFSAGFRDVPESSVRKAIDVARSLRDAPTEYFEAKPLRAVGLEEFAGAAVPDNAPPAALEALRRRGVHTEVYPRGDEAARQAAVDRILELPRTDIEPKFSAEPVAAEPAPLGQPKPPGGRPRVEERVETLDDAIREQRQLGIPAADLNLSRFHRRTWKSLDPEVKGLLAEPDIDQKLMAAQKRRSLDDTEVMALDALVRGRREAKDEARLEYIDAKDTPGEDAAWRRYAQTLGNFVALERANVNDGTGTARALAARGRLMEAAQSKDRQFLKQVFREMPGVDEQGAQEMLRMFESGDPRLSDAIRAATAGRWKQWQTLLRAFLITPSSEVANTLGNTLVQGIEVVDTGIAGGIDWLVSKVRGTQRERYIDEVGAELGGMIEAVPAAMKTFLDERFVQIYKRAWKGESKKIEPGRRLEYQVSPFKSKLGRLFGTSLDALEAGDELFQAPVARGELLKRSLRIARAELPRGTPRDRVQARMLEIAAEAVNRPEAHEQLLNEVRSSTQRRLFRDKPWHVVKIIKNMQDRYPWMAAVLPFVKTPSNIARYAIHHSPLGMLTPEFGEALLTSMGKGKGEMTQGQAADVISRRVVGTMVFGMAVGAAKMGKLTGSGPADPNERKALMETGWRPYSYVVNLPSGKVYVPYNRFDPVAQMVGVAADIVELPNMRDGHDIATKAIGSIAENFTNRTYLKGLIDFTGALNDPIRFAGNYALGIGEMHIPRMAARVAQAIDPVLRDVRPVGRGPGAFMDRVVATAQRNVPGLTLALPARYGPTGEPIERPGEGTLGALMRAVSPVQISPERQGRDLEGLMAQVGYVPSEARNMMTVHGVPVPLDRQNIELLHKADRAASYELRRLLMNPLFDRLPDTVDEGGNNSKEALIRKAYNKHRDLARQEIFRSWSFQRTAREELAKRRATP